MFLLQHTKNLCKQNNITPLRRRGQNFLISQHAIDNIIAAAELDKHDTVLEIGAGLGALTKQIAKYVKKVIAIEIDKKMIPVLHNELKDFKNINIVQGDIRKLSIINDSISHYNVIANLPFNIGGLVLKKFLQRKNKPEAMVIVLQKEVGERIMAKPPKMNLLAVSVQFYSRVKIISGIRKNNFWPQPRVDCVMLKIVPITDKSQISDDQFFAVVKAGFSHPRKYLLNNLANSVILKNVEMQELKNKLISIFKRQGLSPKVRAQELRIDQWIKLARLLL